MSVILSLLEETRRKDEEERQAQHHEHKLTETAKAVHAFLRAMHIKI